MADETESPRRWRVATDLIWTRYEDSDDWVVYDPASADIQHLTASAHQLWLLVSTGRASTIEELATTLAADLGRPLDAELTNATRETLAVMDRAGLVRPEW